MAENKNGNAGGAIAAAAVTAAGNAAITAASNKRQFKNQVKAMELQLKQNKQLWDYQNAYNTPQAQMARLEAAGLNPNLIYGSGAGGMNTAGPLTSPEVPTKQAIRPEVPNGLSTYLQTRQMDAQYQMTLQNIEMARKRGALTDMQTGLTNLKLMREDIRKKNYSDLAQAELDTQKFITLRAGELFANEKTKGGLMDQLHDVRKQQMTSTELDIEFKKNRNDLAKLGIYQSDDVKWRVLLKAAQRMGIDIGELLAKGAEKLKYLLEP